MARSKGLCSICGKGGKLTFEHVPPKASYNEKGLELFKLDDWFAKDESGQMSGGSPQPDGSGLVSLCKSCNEKTGAWYVPEFAKLVRAGISLHQQLNAHSRDDDPDKGVTPKFVHVGIKQVRPLPLLKEIVAMLLAVNGPEFGKQNPALVQFVLEKESRGLPDRYRLFLSLFHGPMARLAGLCFAARTDIGTITYLTEVAYPPFAYLMTVDSTPELSIGEITDWAKSGWHETRDVTLDLLIGFGHTPYPGDYRSRAAIDAEVANSKSALDKAADAGFVSGE